MLYRPLPDETKASTAKALIARFQSNINTVDGADAPLKPRHSFGSNEALPGVSSGGTSPRPSLDVNAAANYNNGRLSTSPGAGAARLTPAALDKLDKYRIEAPKLAGSTSATTATTAGSAMQEGQPTSQNGGSSTANAKEESKPNHHARGASVTEGTSENDNKVTASPSTQRKGTPATPTAKAASSSASTAKKAAPPSPTTRKAEATKSSSQAKASPSKNHLSSDLSKSVSRKVISPLPDTPERQARSSGAASSPSFNRVRTPITSTSTSSPSTSRLMQPTAASRARLAGDEGRKLSSSVSAASGGGPRSSSSAAVHSRPATSMSMSGTSSSPTSRFRRIASESSDNAAGSSASGRRASSSHVDGPSNKTLSPAQLGRLAAAEATGVHPHHSPSGAASRVRKQSLPSSRSRSSLAMAREASHETPTKGARQTVSASITPGRAKVNPSASTSGTTPQSRHSTDPATSTTPSSASTFSRLSKPTASSLAHSKTSSSPNTNSPSSSTSRKAPETPLPSTSSPAGRSTPGSSAKATVGSRLPSTRGGQTQGQTQNSPLAGVKGGPKIGVVTGPKELELKPRPKEPVEPKEDEGGDVPQKEDTEAVSEEAIPKGGEPETTEASAEDLDDIPDIPTAEPSDEQQQEGEASEDRNGDEQEVQKIAAESADAAAPSDQPQSEPPTIVEPFQATEGEEAQSSEIQQKVFTGWSNRPYGKIAIPLHASPAQIPEIVGGPVKEDSSSPKANSPSHATTTTMTDFSDKWGTREGGSLPSPRAVSPATSPTASNDSQTGENKKVPIWLRKGGV